MLLGAGEEITPLWTHPPPGNYRARVFAASVDLTQLRSPGQAAQLDPQFNISSAWSQQTVQVQSVGTLRVVPAPDIAPVLPPEPDVVGGASQ